MTAAVNLKTGKIIGCKENSLAWHHEKGHIVFNNSAKGIKIQLTQNWSIKFFFIMIWALYKYRSYYIWLPAGILLLIYFLIDVYEECWCWKYAYKQIRCGQ